MVSIGFLRFPVVSFDSSYPGCISRCRSRAAFRQAVLPTVARDVVYAVARASLPARSSEPPGFLVGRVPLLK